jgi:cytoskeleton protein RodZ
MSSQKELIPMRPGDLLRYEREQKGLTIERASRQSRIKPSVLEAIESGETGDIPSVYLKGYIRNYARFLDVDLSGIEDHMGNVQGAEPEVRTVFTVKTNRGKAEKWLKASSYLAASALIATLAWQFTHQAVQFSQRDSQQTAATAMPADDAVSDAGAAGPEPRPANTHLNASIASMEILGNNDRDGSSSTAGQAWSAITGEAGGREESSLLRHRLSITTSADTWVEISDAAGDQLELDLIRAGTSREYQGQAPFEVMIGRASAVELNMDGKAVNLGPHTRGNVARLTLQNR